ncbi:WXG100 family type VII secretion target [Streptomyces sp. NBC_01352]|uniref:ESAT-6-like protein n=1 Tax=Streptomyces plumbiresistens TaxID=511811 RepID=A0ABP7TND1_9ACTN|nr:MULTISPECIES: WXG100 family type VII secretion target [unclassified Streptomyces]MCX4697517.1 WXG100 family type VII secretion target [Streptomyces sp. NBC_01373]
MANVHYDGLAVKYGGLDAITTELGNQASKLESDIQALKSAVVRVAAGWEGEAANAFGSKMKEWDADADAIHQALVSIGKKVSDAGGDYRAGDLKAAGYFQ